MAPSKPNPAVFHDYFGIRGGGERLALTLAEALQADLVYGYRNAESYEPGMFPVYSRNLELPVLLRRPGLRAAALSLRFHFARSLAASYRTRIYSGVAAPFAAPAKAQGERNIYYCHTPPRFLFDQKAFFTKDGGSLAKRTALARFESGYRKAIERMDVIIANSKTVQERIERYLDRRSLVVYPPCDTHRFAYRGAGDYYLSTARVTGLKRVGAIVDAFLDMPDKRLLVASGGDELETLRQRARGAKNIEFLGWVSEERLLDLVGHAIATLYGPVDEDFGMSPVESMAAGKPVIGVAEGGLRETILDRQTGILLPPGFHASDIAAAVRELTPEKAGAMRDACESRAQEFSMERFVTAMRGVVGEDERHR